MSIQMRCNVCGGPIDVTSVFCGTCGQRLTSQVLPPPTPQAAPAVHTPPAVTAPMASQGPAGMLPQSTARKRTAAMIAGSIGATALVVGGVVFALMRGNDDSSDRTVSPTLASFVGSTSSPASTSTAYIEPSTTVAATQPTPPPIATFPVTAPPVTPRPKPCPGGLNDAWDLPLAMCDKSYTVQLVQERLNLRGAGLEEDGEFGPATVRAVESFQRDYGLSVTGVVTYGTWYAMFSDWNLPGYDYNSDGVITPDEFYGE